MTREDIIRIAREANASFETAGIPVEDVELVWAIKDLVEAAHGIGEKQ